MFAYCATKWLNIGVVVRLTEVSAECRFILQLMWEENFATPAGVHLGVRLIWGPLNTGFTLSPVAIITKSQNWNILKWVLCWECQSWMTSSKISRPHWSRNGYVTDVTVRLLLKRYRARAAGCINIYYNWTDILLPYDACARITKRHRKALCTTWRATNFLSL